MTSDRATNTDPAAWLCGLLQLGDTFYPTGSYAHSFGLEGLVAEGVVRDRETLRAFLLTSALPALRQTELPLAIHAWQAFEQIECEKGRWLGRADGPSSATDDAEHRPYLSAWVRVSELCQLSSALKTASEARLASENIGRQRSELAANLRTHPLAQEYLRRANEGRWPFSPAIAAALEARVLGAPLQAALASVFYANIAGLLAAAMKLLRLGQNGCQTLLTELMGHAGEAFAAAEKVPIDEIGWFNPWLDIAAARHETANARLFIS
jgi:urease accessory protein